MVDTEALNPDLHVDEGETKDYDTSVGGTDVVKIVENEPKPEDSALAAIKASKSRKQKAEAAACPDPLHNLIGRTVIYYTKLGDQRVLGVGIAPRSGISARVTAQHTDGTVDLETVVRIGNDTVKFLNVAEGGDQGQFRK